MRYILILMVLLSLLVVPVMGQDEVVDCDTTTIATDLTVEIATIEEDPVTALLNILQVAIAGIGDCTGQNYHFSSEVNGQSPVIGPMELPAGFYILTLTSPANKAYVNTTAITEGCGIDLDLSIFFETNGSAADGVQKVVEVEQDCGVLWEIESDGEWALDIVKTG